MTGTTLQRIGDDEQRMFDELLRDVGDFEFEAMFSSDGQFFTRCHGGRDYWYHRKAIVDFADGDRADRPLYVGPSNDAEIETRIARPTRSRVDPNRLRNQAEELRRRGWTAPTNMEGRVLKALSTAGAFRLRAILVGSVAYQAYSGLLGCRLPCASLRTDDVDIAMDFGVSNSIDDTCDDIFAALRQVDSSFSPRPHLNDDVMMATFKSSTDFQVEFLTTHRGSDEHTGRLSRLPSLGSHIGGVPLRYLDFLIRNPVRSIILNDTGVAVTVPAPERFAIHKLMVAACRSAGNPKIAKDLAQAAELIKAHAQKGWIGKVELAWNEAWERGESWRSRLAASAKTLDGKTQSLFRH